MIFIDRLPEFKRRAYPLLDQAMSQIAIDILDKSKNYAPVDKGNLRASAFIDDRLLDKSIYYDIEYAAYQHRGKRKDGSRVVKNYTTSGTGKEYLTRAAKEVLPMALNTLKKHQRRL